MARPKSADKVERDALIIELRAGGRSWQSIAKDVGISDRHCRKIWSDWRDEAKLDIQKLNPIDVVFEHLARLDRDIERLAEIADAKGTQDHTRISAIRAKGRAMAQQAELLQAVGLMPKNIGALRIYVEGHVVVQQVMTLLRKELSPERITDVELQLMEMLRGSKEQLALPQVSEN